MKLPFPKAVIVALGVLTLPMALPGFVPPAVAQIESREGIALRDEILQLRQEVDALRAQVNEQGGASFGGGRSSASESAGGGSVGASDMVPRLLERVNTLEDEIRSLRGRVDELQNEQQQQAADLNKKIGDLQFQLQNPGAAPPDGTAPAPAGAPSPAGTAPPDAPAGVPAGVPAAAVPSGGVAPGFCIWNCRSPIFLSRSAACCCCSFCNSSTRPRRVRISSSSVFTRSSSRGTMSEAPALSLADDRPPPNDAPPCSFTCARSASTSWRSCRISSRNAIPSRLSICAAAGGTKPGRAIGSVSMPSATTTALGNGSFMGTSSVAPRPAGPAAPGSRRDGVAADRPGGCGRSR